MDNEALLSLLERIAIKLDGIEKRLQKVEGLAHEQGVLADPQQRRLHRDLSNVHVC
jgi:hypothetical protein